MPGPESGRWREVEWAFDRALDLDGEARALFLSRLQEADAALAADVVSLLEADTRAGAFLEKPLEECLGELVVDAAEAAAVLPRTPPEPQAPPLSRVGPYRLITCLGRGGMGEVWEAEHEEAAPGERVALKRIRHELDSAELVRRFVRERQILARLDHPAIARLLDAGRDTSGRPYVVLEKVDGQPITEHARRERLPLADRLSLMATCCEAVAAAHRERVVHRDLKPANVLVTRGGELKLLDFGIAKPLDGDAASLTRTGWHFATLDYAAPEQILGHPPALTVDVYALGALLYELVTGRLPHRRTAPRSLADLAAKLAAERAEAPSRVASHAPPEALPWDGEMQRERWTARLRGGLDGVILQALSRAPAERQPSAAELAADLRRLLAAETTGTPEGSLGRPRLSG